jgi:NAD(P)-dependent dehydrogenase (short-subunit alcohol dehydrogenase family)
MASFSGKPRADWRFAAPREAPASLAGKKVAVVGGTGGLGRALAAGMAARGAQVIVVGQTFRDAGTPNLSFVSADLASMKEAARVGRSLPADLDAVLLTTGIMAAPAREVTAEGLERDMAVSYLSRLAILRELAPRLRAGTRVFVMGFPGTGQKGDADDQNAERHYEAFATHMNTVAGNEALVLEWARRYPALALFGLNPGLIKTNIRANYLGDKSLRHRLVEGLIGLFMQSPEAYAERTLRLIWARDLDGRSPAMFNAKGRAIEPTPELTPEYVARFIAGSEALIDRAQRA